MQSVVMVTCPRGCGVGGVLSVLLTVIALAIIALIMIFFQTQQLLGVHTPFVLWVVTPLVKAVLKCLLMASGAPSVMITGALSMHRYMS